MNTAEPSGVRQHAALCLGFGGRDQPQAGAALQALARVRTRSVGRVRGSW